jgi:hypothetical protein
MSLPDLRWVFSYGSGEMCDTVSGVTWEHASASEPWVRMDDDRQLKRAAENDKQLQRVADAAGAVGGERLSEASVRPWALQWRWHWPDASHELRWVAEALTWREVATLDPQGHTGGWLSGDAIDRRLQARTYRVCHRAACLTPRSQRATRRCDGGVRRG